MFLLFVVLTAVVVCPTAFASQVINTSTATGIKLGLNKDGQALISYKQGGKQVEVLAWGAVNADPPSPGGKQVAFQLDYSGGYTLFKDDLAKANAQLRADQASSRRRRLRPPSRA